MSENPQGSPEVRFDGKTVIVTGAGSALGRAYALQYARLGGNVVVNDVNQNAAQAIVDEITKGTSLSCVRYQSETYMHFCRSAGGKAVAAVTSAEDGEGIVKVALDKFGGAHVLVANAGLVRPSAFEQLSEKDWDEILAVHLRATYKVSPLETLYRVPAEVTGPAVRKSPLAHFPQAEVWSHRYYGLSVRPLWVFLLNTFRYI